jgi:hypothetical protein
MVHAMVADEQLQYSNWHSSKCLRLVLLYYQKLHPDITQPCCTLILATSGMMAR